MKNVVYFNQWFSSIALVIDDLKKRNKNQLKIIASSKNKNHAYKKYVDKFIIEDWEETDSTRKSMKNYVDWVINLCKENKVNYFFVKKHATDIMKRASEFEEIGVHLISEKYSTLKSLESKSGVYDKLAKVKGLEKYIPMYVNSSNGRELIELLLEHRGQNDLCLKFDCDEGGASFRAINDTPIGINSLKSFRMNQVTTEEAIQIVATADKPERLIIMEKLDSPEISVDCYNSKKGFIAICRSKEEGRVEKIFNNSEISDACMKIGKKLNLKYPYNVQFRYKTSESESGKERELKLLEVNPRMSGGLYYEVAEDFNIADVVLKDLMGMEKDYYIEQFEGLVAKYVTHLELPIKLD